MNKVTTILSLSASQFQSPIHTAAHEGNLPNLRHILQQTPSLIDQRNEKHKTPLFICSEQGHLRCVQYLIEQRANINYSIQATGKERGATSLWIACRKGHVDIVRELLRNRAEVGKAVVGGITPLYIASEEGHTTIVHELLNYGANVDRAAYNGSTPLFVASYRGHIDVVEKLIEYHAGVNKASSGLTPLYVASQEGYLLVVRLLLRFGADLDKDNNEGNTPLFAAAESGHVEIVQELLKSGANVDSANDQGATPLWIASVNGYHKVVHELLLAAAEVDYDTDSGVSPLYAAAANGHLEVLKELLALDAQVDKMFGDTTPLYVACENGFEEVAKELLAYEADVDLCTDEGASPLYIASSCGYTKIVDLLIAAQSNVDIRCKGLTPLIVASQNGHTDVVRLLLKHKADVDAQRDDGLTSLYAAAQNGHSEIVASLLQWKCEVDVPQNGKTSLYVACQNGHDQVVQLLVENGADVNWKRSLSPKVEPFITGLPASTPRENGGINPGQTQVSEQKMHNNTNGIPSQHPQAAGSEHVTPSSARDSAGRQHQPSARKSATSNKQSVSQHTAQTKPSVQVRHPHAEDFTNIQGYQSSRSTGHIELPRASDEPPQQQQQRGRAQSYSVSSSAANAERYHDQPFASQDQPSNHQPANMSLRQKAMLLKTFGKNNGSNNEVPSSSPQQSPQPSPRDQSHVSRLPSPIAMTSNHFTFNDESSINAAERDPSPKLAPLHIPSQNNSPRSVHSAAAHGPSPFGPQSVRSTQSSEIPLIDGITPIAAACIWNHPSIVQYLLSKDADITILTEDGLSLYDLNINPKIDEMLTRQQTKMDIKLNIRDKFVEKVALKTDMLEKDDIFSTDIEVLWELLKQIQSQEFIVQQVPKSSVLKLIYDRAKEELGDRDAPFDQFEQVMREYNKYQDKVLQQKYIFDHTHLSQFYRGVYGKFTEVMIGALITNQKALQNADVTVNPGVNPMAPKNLAIPSVALDNENFPILENTLLLKGLTDVIQFCTDKSFDSLAQKEIIDGEYSLVAASVAKVSKLTEQIARQLTLRYEHQVNQLKEASVTLASHTAVSRLLHFLTHNEFNMEDPIDRQIVRIIFRFQAIYPKTLETSSPVLGAWTADGMFRCPGIRTKLHALYRLSGDAPYCNLAEDYGFRLGSQKEVQALTMIPTDMSIVRQQYENPLFQLIARRETIPRFSTDKHTNQLELKITRMEQAYRMQQQRFEQAERLLLQQNETIRRLTKHVTLTDELLDEDLDGASPPTDAQKSKRLEKRVKTLIHTMKQFEGTLDDKREREGLTRKDSRTCVVM
mmetsp:Transcript_10540/g.39196  ORF Transcript_10540/g.39196 Transcript_10540/m.39196 type:complete len:1304 (-) Transcript_10540:15-3926(-)